MGAVRTPSCARAPFPPLESGVLAACEAGRALSIAGNGGLSGHVCARQVAHRQLCEMLPSAAVYYFPWEINSSVPEGEALRTFGKLCSYNLVRSEAVLTAQHSSAQHRVCVNTEFVEPFQAQLGSRYLVVGEVEHREDRGKPNFIELRSRRMLHGRHWHRHRHILGSVFPTSARRVQSEGPVLKARILTCVEGMNVPLLEQAIQEQRKYFSERQERMGNSTS